MMMSDILFWPQSYVPVCVCMCIVCACVAVCPSPAAPRSPRPSPVTSSLLSSPFAPSAPSPRVPAATPSTGRRPSFHKSPDTEAAVFRAVTVLADCLLVWAGGHGDGSVTSLTAAAALMEECVRAAATKHAPTASTLLWLRVCSCVCAFV